MRQNIPYIWNLPNILRCLNFGEKKTELQTAAEFKAEGTVKGQEMKLGRFHSFTGHEGLQLYSILDLCTRRGEGSASGPGSTLPPGKTRYPLYRRLCGPQGRSGLVRKISPHRDSIPGPSSPQAVEETKLNLSYLSHSLCCPACRKCKGVSLWRSLCTNFPSETGHLAIAKVNNLEK